ncbi:hypothetical protein D3C87_904060 [compost metagenome]
MLAKLQDGFQGNVHEFPGGHGLEGGEFAVCTLEGKVGEVEFASDHCGGGGEELDAADGPEGFQVGDRASGGEVAPGLGAVADQAGELLADLELELGGDGGGLFGDIVGVVEHRREVADQARDEHVAGHMRDVAGTEERSALLEAAQEVVELLAQAHERGVVGLAALVGFADEGAVFGVEVPPPEDVIPQGLEDEILDDLGIFTRGAKEEGSKR